MRRVSSATLIGRVLLGLRRAQACGVLHFDGAGRKAMLAFGASHIVAANVDRRVATAPEHVLAAASQICHWDGLVLRFVPSAEPVSWWRLDAPLPAEQLALVTLRAAVDEVSPRTIRAELGDAVYHLTPIGSLLVAGAGLDPHQATVAAGLRRGLRARELGRCVEVDGVAAQRFLWMLKLLRAAAPRAAGSAYPLLLRKRREIARHASAHALLDLPPEAPEAEARRALRRLVRDLHPDRFGEGTPPELRRASGEIVTALVEAEASLVTRR